MRETVVEREAEKRTPATAAEGSRAESSLPSAVGAVPSAALSPAMLLGLQAGAGNSAVAALMEQRRPAAPAPTDPLNAGPSAPIEERPPPPVPDLSGADPATGLSQVAGLPPGQLLSSLGSVSAAVGRVTSAEHRELSAHPPERSRHPGSPSTVQSPASSRVVLTERPAPDSPKPIGRTDAAVRPPPEPVLGPHLDIGNGQLPVRDPALELSPGPLPHLALAGNADPGNVQRQEQDVRATIDREHAASARDAAQPLGEDQIFPQVAQQTLRAAVPEAPGSNGHAPSSPGDDDEAVSIVAEEERGSEIHGAVASGVAALGQQRQQYLERSAAERKQADEDMGQLEQSNAQQQTTERLAAKNEVLSIRTQWTGAQQELVAAGQTEASAKTKETLDAVARDRLTAQQEAVAHYQQGQQEADVARRRAEEEARAEKQKAQSQGAGGLIGAIGSVAQSLFDKAKQVVTSVFDRARQLVKAAIQRAQQLATAVMEKARQAIVATISAAGSALTAISDRVLAGFPVLRDRFRRLIQDRIAAAESGVNKLADALKQLVLSRLNLLGTVLTTAIGLLSSGMNAAVDAVRSTVRGALDFARGTISALGVFGALVRDVAANPGQWISNLAAAARDGIAHHVWPDLKAAVESWFNDKLEMVLGLGSGIWSILQKGGISIAQVGRMAWDGLKAMIPQTVLWILIEKLVALIVPAAAAVVLIIQALQAAWASLSRIVQAFDAFMAFLKKVRWGDAGPLFGMALAQGAVAVVEFISQFLLQRLMTAGASVAAKFRTLARRIQTHLRAGPRADIRLAESSFAERATAPRSSDKPLGNDSLGTSDTDLRDFTHVPAKGIGPRNDISLPGHEFAQSRDFSVIEADGTRAVRYGPLNKGPLHDLDPTLVESFRSSSYTGRTLAQSKRLYRVYSDPRMKLGAFWTDVKPAGNLQAILDLAILPAFRNRATKIVEIEVPSGTTVFEGIAGSQNDVMAGISRLGGGRQIVITNVDPSWEVNQ